MMFTFQNIVTNTSNQEITVMLLSWIININGTRIHFSVQDITLTTLENKQLVHGIGIS